MWYQDCKGKGKDGIRSTEGAAPVIEPSGIHEMLREHHLPTLSEYDCQLLAATIVGCATTEIAGQVFKSEHTVAANVASLLARICDAAGLVDMHA